MNEISTCALSFLPLEFQCQPRVQLEVVSTTVYLRLPASCWVSACRGRPGGEEGAAAEEDASTRAVEEEEDGSAAREGAAARSRAARARSATLFCKSLLVCSSQWCKAWFFGIMAEERSWWDGEMCAARFEERDRALMLNWQWKVEGVCNLPPCACAAEISMSPKAQLEVVSTTGYLRWPASCLASACARCVGCQAPISVAGGGWLSPRFLIPS